MIDWILGAWLVGLVLIYIHERLLGTRQKYIRGIIEDSKIYTINDFGESTTYNQARVDFDFQTFTKWFKTGLVTNVNVNRS